VKPGKSHVKKSVKTTAKKSVHAGAGIERKLHNPEADHLSPVFPLDLGKVRSIDDLVSW
jgi:hypothetical protein